MTTLNILLIVLCIQPIVEALQSHTPGLPLKLVFVSIAVILNIVIFVAILNFLRFHIGLILDNLTTLEILEKRRAARDDS